MLCSGTAAGSEHESVGSFQWAVSAHAVKLHPAQQLARRGVREVDWVHPGWPARLSAAVADPVNEAKTIKNICG